MEKHERQPSDDKLKDEAIVWDAINWLVKHGLLDELQAEQQMAEWFYGES